MFECWEWQGFFGGAGKYPRMQCGGRSQPQKTVHREMYKHFIGPIPDGLTMDHLCENKKCVNPLHVEPVTTKENLQRAYEDYVCPRGHELTGDNLYIASRGHRECRKCRNDASHRWNMRASTKGGDAQ